MGVAIRTICALFACFLCGAGLAVLGVVSSLTTAVVGTVLIQLSGILIAAVITKRFP